MQTNFPASKQRLFVPECDGDDGFWGRALECIANVPQGTCETNRKFQRASYKAKQAKRQLWRCDASRDDKKIHNSQEKWTNLAFHSHNEEWAPHSPTQNVSKVEEVEVRWIWMKSFDFSWSCLCVSNHQRRHLEDRTDRLRIVLFLKKMMGRMIDFDFAS